jgi:hypothetical protein
MINIADLPAVRAQLERAAKGGPLGGAAQDPAESHTDGGEGGPASAFRPSNLVLQNGRYYVADQKK